MAAVQEGSRRQSAHTCMRSPTASQWPRSAHTARAAPTASGRSAPGLTMDAVRAASDAACSDGGSPLYTARRDSSSPLGSGRGWADSELQISRRTLLGLHLLQHLWHCLDVFKSQISG